MTTPPAPWTDPCDHPNWRDHPAELDTLCEIGARQLYGPAIAARDVNTIDLQGGYL